MDLARNKSEALNNIYSLLKQNIKSCNAKWRRQRRRTVKNNNRSNQQKSNFACAAHFSTFLCHYFHNYNVKLPETAWLYILWSKYRTCSCSLFFHCRSFSTWWPLAFLIFSRLLQNFMFSSTKNVSFVFSLSLQLSFSLRFTSPSRYFLFLYIPNLWA